MIKYGTLAETRGYDRRILGETSSSFKDLIFAKFQNFDADYQERLTRSSKIFPGVGTFSAPGPCFCIKILFQGRAFDYLINSPGFAWGGGVDTWN